MGALPIILMILAMKVPILGLIWFVFWVGRVPETEPPDEARIRGHRPRRPRPPLGRDPRRRGPHGGAAVRPLPAGHEGRVHAPAGRERVASALRH